MKRAAGTYAISTTLGEAVQSFVPHPHPHPLPPAEPAVSPDYLEWNQQADLALARLSGVSGLKKNRSYSYRAYIELLSR